MFSRKKLQHIFKIFIVFLNLFLAFQDKLMAQNSSAFNSVRISKNVGVSYCADVDLATSNQKTRTSGCFSSKYNFEKEECIKPDFKFDPFGNNDDLDWNYGNDYCLSYIVGAGVTMEAAFIGCRLLCPGPPASIGKKAFEKLTQGPIRKKFAKVANVAKQASGATNLVASGMMGGMPLDPFTIIELGIFAARCAGVLESTNCCSALAICGTASSVAIGIVGGIYETAKDVFDKVHICGRGWKSFVNPLDSSGTIDPATAPNQYKSVDGKYKQCLNVIFGGTTITPPPFHDCTNKKTKSQKQFCDLIGGTNNCAANNSLATSGQPQYPKFTNVHYREYFYKGIEYVDNGSNPCKNPQDTDQSTEWGTILGYNTSEDDHQNQKYYLRGPRELPNFACKRFLQLGKTNVEGMKAFLCCNEKSQNTICLETEKNINFVESAKDAPKDLKKIMQYPLNIKFLNRKEIQIIFAPKHIALALMIIMFREELIMMNVLP